MAVNIFLPQVTRIPITGPEPYNTLVSVSVDSIFSGGLFRDGVLKRFAQRVTTPFRLAGFDQRVPPIFDHSTTAWISSTGPTKDGNWIIAVDSISGAGFNPTDGSYYIDLMGAGQVDGAAPGTCFGFAEGIPICFYTPRLQITSWVLCYEPPIVPLPQGHIHQLNDLVRQGFSPADLARIPTKSPARTAAADHIRRILGQFGIPISMSVSGAGSVTSGSRCVCAGSGCSTCEGGGGGNVYRDGTGTVL